MKISFDCAATSWAAPSTPVTARASAAALSLNFISPPPFRGVRLSTRERPEPQLLLPDRPQPREAVRLDDQEKHDECAEDHGLDVRGGGGGLRNAKPAGDLVEHQRQDHDERGAEEGAEDRSESADDHHEEQLERAVHVEGERL